MVDFQTEVLDSKEPVLVDFWAEWCGPCRIMTPVVEELSEEKKIKLVKVNIDEQLDIATTHTISSIPAILRFENGKETGRVVGAMPKAKITAALGL